MMAKLGFLLMTLIGLGAQARIEVECIKNNCLEHGWLVYLDSRLAAEVACTNNNCSEFGWESRDSFGGRTRAVCMQGGCFVAGWVEYNTRTRQEIRRNVCNEVDHVGACWRMGWVTYENGAEYPTLCRQSSCSKEGWETFYAGRGRSTTLCTNQDCFQFGWRIYQ